MSKKKPLIGITVKVRPDQLEYLDERGNKSEWVRDAIDMKMRIEAGGREGEDLGVMGVVYRVDALQREKRTIVESEAYQRALRTSSGEIIREEYKPVRIGSQDRETRTNLKEETLDAVLEELRELIDSGRDSLFHIVKGALKFEYLEQSSDEMMKMDQVERAKALEKKSKISISPLPGADDWVLEHGTGWPSDLQLFIEKTKNAHAYEMRVLDAIRRRLAEIDAEIEKVRQTLL